MEMFVHMVFIANENMETNLFPGNPVLRDVFSSSQTAASASSQHVPSDRIRAADNAVSDTEPLGSAAWRGSPPFSGAASLWEQLVWLHGERCGLVSASSTPACVGAPGPASHLVPFMGSEGRALPEPGGSWGDPCWALGDPSQGMRGSLSGYG